MTIPILAAAVLLQAQPAPGAVQWEPLGAAHNGLTHSVDPASIARTGDRVSLRMRTLRAAPDPNGVVSAVIAFTLDCRARTATLEGVDLYKADGSLDRSLGGDEPQPVGRDPMQRALFERACRAPAAAPAPAAPAPAPAPGN
ncbi:MAG TPA: surface-adhesin E family protein [Allosphingosinicella sp.]|nr:surface-adhesin E family protein [Allosphingosinicella sp.]